ncbi:alpha/beta fold hydrolase [Streptomyces xanthochromogenes]|uniref:thioesterase II family protein n=1 Tax=Streptomyces xanthochromogenes TaxID=67384 RepID=UPI00342A7B36
MTQSTLTDAAARSGAVVRPRPVADPALRVFLLHHAAGSHLAFSDWTEHFPADWEVCLLEAPGRGQLGHVPPYRDARGLAGHLLDAVADLLDRPFVLFGHSMGALIAYEMAAQLADRGLPEPVWLGVSACEAPYDAGPGDGRPLYLLPDAQLRAALGRMGGMPPSILADDDLWALFEGRVRADFSVVETWEPRAGRPDVRVPLSLFGGDRDQVVPLDQLEAWADGAEHFAGQHLYPGGHFYFEGRADAVVAQVVEDVRTALGRPVSR